MKLNSFHFLSALCLILLIPLGIFAVYYNQAGLPGRPFDIGLGICAVLVFPLLYLGERKTKKKN